MPRGGNSSDLGDKTMARKPGGKVGELKLALARSLFRADKWDPARDQSDPFEWELHRNLYVDKADRLLRTFTKDGLTLAISERDSAQA